MSPGMLLGARVSRRKHTGRASVGGALLLFVFVGGIFFIIVSRSRSLDWQIGLRFGLSLGRLEGARCLHVVKTRRRATSAVRRWSRQRKY